MVPEHEHTYLFLCTSIILKDINVSAGNQQSTDEGHDSNFPYFWRIASPSATNKPSFLLGIVTLPHSSIIPALPDNVKEALEVCCYSLVL